MFKQMALITWQGGTNDAARTAVLAQAKAAVRADLSSFAETVPGSHHGGDVVWHLHFPNHAVWETSGARRALDTLEADSSVASVDAAAYAVQRFGVTRPDLRNGIYRTLFFEILPHASAEDVRALTRDLAGMPGQIPEILNWAINETVYARGGLRWSHVWEQEFADIGGLTGPYMTSPYHWAYVDRWFDPELPERIMDDNKLCHRASNLEAGVMARYRQPKTSSS
jgi:hypothetical protein